MGGVLAALEPVQIASILVKAGMYVSVLLAAGSVINLWLLTELDAAASRRLRRQLDIQLKLIAFRVAPALCMY